MTAPSVSGGSRLCFVVGDPILQARTPQALNVLAQARGIDAIALPLHVAASQLRAVLGGCRAMQNLNGLVVTLPHKVAAAQLCDALTPRARLSGAVNLIRREVDHRLHGDLLDGVGFATALERGGYPFEDARVYIAGSGGAARAIAFALAERRVARIGIANRTGGRADELVARLRQSFPAIDVERAGRTARGYDLVVNATSLGLRAEDDLPLDPASLSPEMLVADVVMNPPTTPLLRIASEIGCRVQRGQAMLDGQIDQLAERLGFAAEA